MRCVGDQSWEEVEFKAFKAPSHRLRFSTSPALEIALKAAPASCPLTGCSLLRRLKSVPFPYSTLQSTMEHCTFALTSTGNHLTSLLTCQLSITILPVERAFLRRLNIFSIVKVP